MSILPEVSKQKLSPYRRPGYNIRKEQVLKSSPKEEYQLLQTSVIDEYGEHVERQLVRRGTPMGEKRTQNDLSKLTEIAKRREVREIGKSRLVPEDQRGKLLSVTKKPLIEEIKTRKKKPSLIEDLEDRTSRMKSDDILDMISDLEFGESLDDLVSTISKRNDSMLKTKIKEQKDTPEKKETQRTPQKETLQKETPKKTPRTPNKDNLLLAEKLGVTDTTKMKTQDLKKVFKGKYNKDKKYKTKEYDTTTKMLKLLPL